MPETSRVHSVAPPSRALSPAWRDAIILTALVVLGFVLCLVRVPAAHHDIVWAEDANIFLIENLTYGPIETLFRGYAGYQHLIPRLGSAGVLATVPLEGYAVAVYLVSSLLTGLIGAAVYWLSRDVVPWIPARVTLALLTFVIPLAAQEVIGNLADIHSYFMWLAPWLFFYRPRSWWSGSLWAVVAFVTVMTEVQSVIFLALGVFLLRPSRRYSWPILGAFAIGTVWQLLTAFTVDRDSTASWLGASSIVHGWLINTVMPLLVTNPASVVHQLQTTGFLIPAIVLIPIVAAFVVVMIWGTAAQRILVITFALASAAIYAGGAVVDGSWWFRYSEPDAQIWERIINSRYGVSSGLMLVGIVPVAAAVIRRGDRLARMNRAVSGVLAWGSVAGLVVVLAVAGTQAVSSRGNVDGQWSTSVRAAVDDCRTSPADTEVWLPVAPARAVVLTCEQVLR